MNRELRGMWQEVVVVAKFRVLFWNSPEETKINYNRASQDNQFPNQDSE
jgi:hypothetical protein